MPYNLGIKPDRLKIFLYRDADFDSVLTRRDDAGVEADWGTTDVRLVFPNLLTLPNDPTSLPVTWVPTVVGPTVTFNIDKAVTNLVGNGEPVELWVGDQCWAAGKVSKKGELS